jgi:hypothetical protein
LLTDSNLGSVWGFGFESGSGSKMIITGTRVRIRILRKYESATLLFAVCSAIIGSMGIIIFVIIFYLAGDAEDEGICETGDKLPTDVIQDILSLCR